MTTAHYGPTTAEAERSKRKMKEWSVQMLAKPGAVKEFMVKNGFVTKTGKLPKKYRS